MSILRGGRRKFAAATIALGLSAAALVPVVAANARAATPQLSGRYIALGDSVPYGHGLANPTKTKIDGLAPNQPPSRNAYPSRLAKALGLTLTIRSKGCTLGGGQLAVSGAPAVAEDVNGPDTDCGSTKRHKVVDPDQISKVAKSPTTLVTIQVGADDLAFSGCILHELGVSSKYKLLGQSPRKCTQGTGVTDTEARRITRMRVGLNSILNTIKNKLPKATVVVINYYQPIPAPSQYTTLDKSYVCRRLSDPDRLKTAYTHAVTVGDSLNRNIKQALATHEKVRLVNLALGSGFTGHAMCTKNAYLFSGGPQNRFWRVGQPNLAGQAAIAAAVMHQVPSLHK
jgi:GDSL-like Lipase/Acylhydrolase family